MRKGADPVAAGSWWAARAKAGEVAPGFSRDEILRPAKQDPRAEGGLFARLGGLAARVERQRVNRLKYWILEI